MTHPIVLYLLAAAICDGILEGYHWNPHGPPLVNPDFDLYHPLAGLFRHGSPYVVLVLAALWGLPPWYHLAGLVLAGPLGLREWMLNAFTRRNPLPRSKQPLRVGPWTVARHPILQAVVCVGGGGLLLSL